MDCAFCGLEHTSYGFLGLLLDLPSASFIGKTIGIDLLRAGRARGKPSVLGNYLDFRRTEDHSLEQRCANSSIARSILISRLEIEFGKIALYTQQRSTYAATIDEADALE